MVFARNPRVAVTGPLRRAFPRRLTSTLLEVPCWWHDWFSSPCRHHRRLAGPGPRARPRAGRPRLGPVLDARHERALHEAVRELPGGPHPAIAGDVADPAHRRDLVDVAAELGGAAPLVNNASTLGASPLPSLAELDPATYLRILEVNLVAPVALTAALLPQLRDPRRRRRQRDLRRVGRGLRDLGRLRLLQGRPRPRHPGAGGRGAVAAGVRRRPRRHADPDAPGRVPGRGHLRPPGADASPYRRCCACSRATCRAAATGPSELLQELASA